MNKADKDPRPAPAPKPQAVAVLCSVCGQPGNLIGDTGPARWHAACAAARPDVIAKVKARA